MNCHFITTQTWNTYLIVYIITITIIIIIIIIIMIIIIIILFCFVLLRCMFVCVVPRMNKLIVCVKTC